MTFNQELVAKAKQAENAEELLQLAQENGIELTAEEAEQHYAQLHADGELSDDELDNVSGGGCKNNEQWYKVGDRVWFCPFAENRDDGLFAGVIKQVDKKNRQYEVDCTRGGVYMKCRVGKEYVHGYVN